MKAIKILLASSLLAAALPSMAGTTFLNFEDAPAAPALAKDYYASLSEVTFSENAWVTSSAQFGGFGNFYNAPGDLTGNVGALILTANPDPDPDNLPLPADSFTIRLDGGFNFFSMRFTGEGSVSVIAFDATGARLGAAGASALVPAPQECLPNFVCKWAPLSIDLGDETASWITVSGADGKLWFDDLLFVANDDDGNPPVDVPEPGGVALSLAALGALAWSRKRSS